MVDKIDSNSVGQRYAIEASLGVLPGSPVWYEGEPNSYGDYGPQYSSTARAPINASRQRRKGNLTDVEVPGAIGADFTDDLYRLMPSFMFAAWREKKNFSPSAITSTTTFAVTGNSGAGAVYAGDLVFGENFTNAANNVLKTVASVSSTTGILTTGLVNETAPATAKLTKVGHQYASGDVSVTQNGDGTVTIASAADDFTKLNIIPGEWIWVGGDAAGLKFATAADNGWYRVKTVAALAIVCDRVPGTVVTDAGTGKTIQIFIGHLIKNESDPTLIVRTSVQLERAFGNSLDNEYLKGQVGNELSLDIRSGRDSQIRADMSFMGTQAERAAAKSGDRPAITSTSGYTGTNDVGRLRLQREDTDATLATYVEGLKVTISNGCSYNKAIGVLGAWEISVGDFTVMAEADCFFSSHAAAQAIEQNADVSIDFALCTLNRGWTFDLPLVTLSDGRPNVQKDQAVKLPLAADAVAHATLNHTLSMGHFRYLPDLAE